MDKLKIGISIGDINGIGLEIILKTLSNPKITQFFVPVVYGSSKVVSYHKNIVGIDFHFQSIRGADRLNFDKINIVNCWQDNVNITLGKPSEDGGKYAIRSLEVATQDLRNGLIDALVTAPINKHAMQLGGFNFPGHTEYLTEHFGNGQSLMLMVSDQLKVGTVTNHIPLGEVAQKISKQLIIKKLKIFNETLKMDFGLERPTIAVLGLNPHAGDNGLLGEEEEKIIRPAIVESKKKGILAMGPFPADGFFGSKQFMKFDGILAMYHDQGLIPFKALTFGEGVNFTAGLECVRTSPDHGTAYDIAGQNLADPASFRKAIFLALDIARQRQDYLDLKANALVKKEHLPEGAEADEEVIEEG